MFKIPNIQESIDDLVQRYGIDDYVESARYLPNDAPVTGDATHVLTLASVDGKHKVQVAIKAKPGLTAALANSVLDAV